jgi:hypothetical protein
MSENSIIGICAAAVFIVFISGVSVTSIMKYKYNVRNVQDRCEVWHK